MATAGNTALLSPSTFPDAKDYHIVVVKTEWNAPIIDALEAGVVKVLNEVAAKMTTLVVPGAVEIPFAIKSHANGKGNADAYIALGCVIKGGTPHFEYVCQSVTNGITLLNNQLEVPVIYGVLTLNNDAEAWERLGGIHGHKGEEAAITALKMIALNKQLNTFSLPDFEKDF